MHTERPHIVPKYVIYGFFLLGLISAVAFRSLIIFQHVEPRWVRPVWYVGIIGYCFFFLYRYRISKKRKRTVDEFRLIEKLKSGDSLSDEDRKVLLYLLSSIKASLEDMNYAVIFLLSVAAIIADLVLSALG
ncbi:MAG TPA: hypothetical protein ENJ04_04655 [Nitrospirae bacterium]|nr:hypothetical protein [Nitrospirota bacterium]